MGVALKGLFGKCSARIGHNIGCACKHAYCGSTSLYTTDTLEGVLTAACCLCQQLQASPGSSPKHVQYLHSRALH